MATTSTRIVYAQVIEDVISKIREGFIKNDGPGQGVLNELRRLWESKMTEVEAIFDPIDRSSMNQTAPGPMTNPVHDLNVPYEELEEYEIPTADLLFPPDCLYADTITDSIPNTFTCSNTITGTVHSSYNIPTEGTSITPNPYMDFFDLSSGKRKRDDFPSQYSPRGYIPQQDGTEDLTANNSETYNYQEVVNEDYNVANTNTNTPAPSEIQIPTPVKNDDDEDEPLNANDDDDHVHGDEFEIYYIILALFDKVTRTKRKWKCNLTNGFILHRNTKDVLFNKATGEFDF